MDGWTIPYTDYLRSIIGQLCFSRYLLVWDSYRCHTSQFTWAETALLHIYTAVVPGDCTKFIQAPDVVWNSCFKRAMRMQYDAWIAKADGHEYAWGGNMKPPSRLQICEWVKASWAALSLEIIKEYFVSCAITLTMYWKNLASRGDKESSRRWWFSYFWWPFYFWHRWRRKWNYYRWIKSRRRKVLDSRVTQNVEGLSDTT